MCIQLDNGFLNQPDGRPIAVWVSTLIESRTEHINKARPNRVIAGIDIPGRGIRIGKQGEGKELSIQRGPGSVGYCHTWHEKLPSGHTWRAAFVRFP